MIEDIRISNSRNESLYVDVPNAVVNKNAMWTTISSEFAPYLQLPDLGPAPAYALADEEGLRHSFARLELRGKHIVTSVLLSDTVEGAVIGATTLASLGLAIDPAEEELVEAELQLN